MAEKAGKTPKPYNIVIVGQAGRLQYEAVLFAASLRANSPDFAGRLIVAEPQPGPLWQNDPTMRGDDTRDLLAHLGAEIVPFATRHFGQAYPYGNKIEALFALPKGEPFVFFDTDTLITGDLATVPFDFDRPTASLRREGTWPEIQLYGPGYTATWKSLYDKFGLDFESSLDANYPDEFWRRYLYFNAGFFFYKCPHVFGQRFLDYALDIRDDAPPELICQSLDPWLDQVALPLVIHSLGGGARHSAAGAAGWGCQLSLPPASLALRPRIGPRGRGVGRSDRPQQDQEGAKSLRSDEIHDLSWARSKGACAV